HGTQKNCGIKTCVRVVGEVFYTSGKIRVEVVAPHCIPDDSTLTAAEQQGHQVALCIEPHCEFTSVRLHQTLICRRHALPYCLITERRGQEQVGVKPALFHPWGPKPAVQTGRMGSQK